MAKFVNGHRPSAPRISDDRWESLKGILLEKSQIMTFGELEIYMGREYNFFAKKRQLGHRIRGVWGFRKYKQGSSRRPPGDPVSRNQSPPPPAAVRERLVRDVPKTKLPPMLATPALAALPGSSSSQPDSEDVKTRYLCLADILVAFRDSHHAFDINVALWKASPSSSHTLACIGTAQHETQLIMDTREMARRDAEPFLMDGRSPSWATTFMDLLNAHTYVWGTGKENGLGQIARIFSDIIGDGVVDGREQDCLVELAPRGPHLDVPAYTLLRAALEWYNSESQDDRIDAPSVLGQFIAQHLSARRGPEQMEAGSNHDINCLPLCLEWCRVILGSNPDILPEIRGTDGDIVTETFAVLCLLWRPLLGNGPPSYRAVAHRNTTASLNWASTAEQQLGIRPTQLLCTVVCMIMAAAIQQQNVHARQSLPERALAGANALSALGLEALLHRFLNQTCADNWRLKLQTDAERGFPIWRYSVDAQNMEPFRRFAAESLGIYDFPTLENGSCVLDELALAGPEFSEDGF
ncbi:uncharacterized protein B0H64DRAFT_443137 [Chaetomium fimeti]|uniref:Clr5 domain-containing protein n=1 Tax=Chaetomium fimeti TaxID=1854472 RepID=A0AAE0LRC9_9PEZI|nr:hypothetical protein B0H64DRAFT_443137 [Chaetomium fimeti]